MTHYEASQLAIRVRTSIMRLMNGIVYELGGRSTIIQARVYCKWKLFYPFVPFPCQVVLCINLARSRTI